MIEQQTVEASLEGHLSFQSSHCTWTERTLGKGGRRFLARMALLVLVTALGPSAWASEPTCEPQRPLEKDTFTRVTVTPPHVDDQSKSLRTTSGAPLSTSKPSSQPVDPLDRLQTLVAQAQTLRVEVQGDFHSPNLPNIRRRLELLEQIRSVARPLLHAGKNSVRLETRQWVAQAHESFARALDGLGSPRVANEELLHAWESQREIYRDVARMRAVAHFRSCASLGAVFGDKSSKQIAQKCTSSLQEMGRLPGAPLVKGGLQHMPKSPGKLAALRIEELSVCVTESAMNRPDDVVPTAVVATLQVNARGEVTQVALDVPSGSEGMGACLADGLKLWAFPFIGSATTLEIPIELSVSKI